MPTVRRLTAAPRPKSMPKGAVQRFAGLGSAIAGLGSALAGLMFVWSMVRPFLPRNLFKYYIARLLRRHARWLMGFLDPWLSITITEHDPMGVGLVYDRAKAYLSSHCASQVRSLRAELAARGTDRFVLSSMDHHEEVADEFQGATVWWHSSVSASGGGDAGAGRAYRLVFHERHRELIVESYLPHVFREGRTIMASKRRQKLFTNTLDRHSWSYVVFEHPSTFDTLAMDPAKKRAIMDDLDAFRNGKDYYARIGKAWKRGYLLYGPPGTGKSTMIAAMANYLDYDIYDIELTSVSTNIELQRLFIETKGKSIIVVEDIDCSADLAGKRETKEKKPPAPGPGVADASSKNEKVAARKVTLSGLLNAIDGLWSACGGERIIVLTTNHVEKLDPALIRRGRMDMHIEMSYCCFEAFRILAKNYLGMDAHHLFDNVKDLLHDVRITPADVAEHLMPKCASDDAESCLASLVKALAEMAKQNATAMDDFPKDDEIAVDK